MLAWVKAHKDEIIISSLFAFLILLLVIISNKEEGVGESCCQKICKSHNMTCWSSSNDYVRCFSRRTGAGYQEVVNFHIYDKEQCCA